MNNFEKLIRQLKMILHSESGYFVEAFHDKNNSVNLIYYLFLKGHKSHWHQLTKNEI